MNTEIGSIYNNLKIEEERELWYLCQMTRDREIKHIEEGSIEIIELKEGKRLKAQNKNSSLKYFLSSIDYCIIKCMETRESMATLYPEVHAKRTDARQRINELEAIIS